MNKLNSKDYINIGIFTTLFFISNILVSSLIVTPFMQYVMMPLIALVTGPIYILYVSKIKKFGAITIVGIFCSLVIGLLVFGSIPACIINLIIFLLAELIAYLGKYKDFKYIALSYIVVSFYTIGEVGLIWYARDSYYNISIQSGISSEFTQKILDLGSYTTLFIMIICVIICSILSIILSKKLFNKHFKKLGII